MSRTLLAALDPEDGPHAWKLRGACALPGAPWHRLFHPARGQRPEGAKAVCRGCTVRLVCLDDALARDERHGIWGGATARERRALTHRPAARRPRTTRPGPPRPVQPTRPHQP